MFLAYLTESDDQITIVHAFADTESLDLHFQGTVERAKVGFELFDPDGWEIYGHPSDVVLASMREMAAGFGVTLTHQPESSPDSCARPPVEGVKRRDNPPIEGPLRGAVRYR